VAWSATWSAEKQKENNVGFNNESFLFFFKKKMRSSYESLPKVQAEEFYQGWGRES